MYVARHCHALRWRRSAFHFTTNIGREIVQDVKDASLCDIVLDFVKEATESADMEITYELLVGNAMFAASARFRCHEVLSNQASSEKKPVASMQTPSNRGHSHGLWRRRSAYHFTTTGER